MGKTVRNSPYKKQRKEGKKKKARNNKRAEIRKMANK